MSEDFPELIDPTTNNFCCMSSAFLRLALDLSVSTRDLMPSVVFAETNNKRFESFLDY